METKTGPLDEVDYISCIRHFIGIVGETAFGNSIQGVAHCKTLDEATHSYHKSLRQVDVFKTGDLDMMLYSLLSLPQSGAFWEVFEAVCFPPKKKVYKVDKPIPDDPE